MSFYQKFSDLCSENGVFKSKVAVDCGLSKASVTRWKEGSTPSNETIKKIADYFYVPVSYFSEETENAPAEADALRTTNSDVKVALMQAVINLPDDKCELLLKIVKAIK